MEKITRKAFLEILTENTSILAGSVFRWNDKKCIAGMETIKAINEKAERRTVTEKHTNYILFSNGSRLAFDQEGKYDYFIYENKNGVKFAIQRLTRWDDFDEAEYLDYIVYIVIEAEAQAERKFYSVDLDETEKSNLCRWLKANGYYYEASGNFECYHLEIKCSTKEAEIINRKLEKMKEMV